MTTAEDLIVNKKLTLRYSPNNRLYIIGCGGIGSHLWDFIAHELWTRADLNKKRQDSGDWGGLQPIVSEVILIDNDVVEHKNLYRQSYFEEHIGLPKSEALAQKYRPHLSRLNIEVKSEQAWIDEEYKFIDYSNILLCVDNNATRKMVSRIIKNNRYENINLISGGNRDSLVTVQVMIKQFNMLRSSLEHMHPEVTNPEDEHPRDASCTDETTALNDPQTFRANLMAATQMFQQFVNTMDNKCVDFCELWMDVDKTTFRKEDIPTEEILSYE